MTTLDLDRLTPGCDPVLADHRTCEAINRAVTGLRSKSSMESRILALTVGFIWRSVVEQATTLRFFFDSNARCTRVLCDRPRSPVRESYGTPTNPYPPELSELPSIFRTTSHETREPEHAARTYGFPLTQPNDRQDGSCYLAEFVPAPAILWEPITAALRRIARLAPGERVGRILIRFKGQITSVSVAQTARNEIAMRFNALPGTRTFSESAETQ